MKDVETIATHGDETVIEKPERVLELARERHAAGAGVRGLPRPEGWPPAGWYAQRSCLLASGETAVYLQYKWRTPVTEQVKARTLGRLN